MSTCIENILGQPAGSIVTVNPDHIVINDGISHAAADEITAVANPDRVWVIYDHDVPAGSSEAAAVLKKNLQFAEAYNCRYVQAAGVGYQYMLNEVVKAGEIIIGGGSHGAIFGAAGALGINVSIPELARVVETGRYSMIVPETVSVTMTGSGKEGVGTIDIGLALLQEVTGVKHKSVDIYAPDMNPEDQAVLCSIVGGSGAFTVFISQEEGEDAITFDISNVEPMLMLPCKTRQEQKLARIEKKKALAGTVLQAGQIGGYTGGTIAELRKAAELIKGKTLAFGFRLTVCPATSRDYIQAMEEGIITAFIDYGAQISAAGDHSVVTQGAGAMGPGEKLITTGLYTFSGAMGCEDVLIYTGSVESVIAASVTKMI